MFVSTQDMFFPNTLYVHECFMSLEGNHYNYVVRNLFCFGNSESLIGPATMRMWNLSSTHLSRPFYTQAEILLLKFIFLRPSLYFFSLFAQYVLFLLYFVFFNLTS